jgi:hypothetical protein
MTSTAAERTAVTRDRRTGSPLPALAGVGALAAFAGAVATFTDRCAARAHRPKQPSDWPIRRHR